MLTTEDRQQLLSELRQTSTEDSRYCEIIAELKQGLIGYGAGMEIYEDGDRYIDEWGNLVEPEQLVYGLEIKSEPTSTGPAYTYMDRRYGYRVGCPDSLIRQSGVPFEEITCPYCGNVDLRPPSSHSAPCLRCGAE